ncbi:MAG: phosphoglucosamine mutase [Bacteroidetes bacterium]|nr:phosphoglucosamine mutase [Bacteroidota bacterium]
MALMKSISGIRGTIGGEPGNNLTPIDIVKFAAAYGSIILQKNKGNKIVIGRDARMSGAMVSQLVSQTLVGLGAHVIDLGLSTTPTVEMAVVFENAAGGIILTASHNPKEWNALKLLNEKGEFISAEEGKQVLALAENEKITFTSVDDLGAIQQNDNSLQKHIYAILAHPFVNKSAVEKKNFKVVVDAINSSGAFAVPALLKSLGVTDVIVLNEEMHGNFAHNPEPLAEHLTELCSRVVGEKADLGIAVDPDVDRLCFVSEDGTLFGEEYTLVAVADYILKHKPGSTVSNLSSTRALRDITLKYGGHYYASAVGEVNVVTKMKEVNAVIGGEGNGGIIDPQLHYGRDALIGVALFLSHLAATGLSVSALRKTYPDYKMVKDKVILASGTDLQSILKKVEAAFPEASINTIDGLKMDFENTWVHLRASNTEPIVRIYAEALELTEAQQLVDRVKGLMG